MRATSHAGLTVDGVGTKSRDLVQERATTQRTRRTDLLCSARKFAENKYAMKIHTQVCEQLKILTRTENKRERERRRGEDLTRDSKFNPFLFNRALKKNLNETLNFEHKRSSYLCNIIIHVSNAHEN